MKYLNVSLLICFVLSLCLLTQAQAGTVAGRVYYEGAVPTLRPIDMSADPVCMHQQEGETSLSEMLVVGEEVDGMHSLGNVFIEVVDGLDPAVEFPVPETPVVLTQAGCRYDPRVFGVRVGQTLQILNPDGTLHNVNGLPRINRPFNLAMPRERQTLDVVFDQPEPLFPIRCDVHPWMAAYCAVLEHPFFTVTRADGQFRIENLPPGRYELRAWHERLGEQLFTVEITPENEQVDDLELRFSRPGQS